MSGFKWVCINKRVIIQEWIGEAYIFFVFFWGILAYAMIWRTFIVKRAIKKL